MQDESSLAALYAEFADEDRALAEEGIEEYARTLEAEDALKLPLTEMETLNQRMERDRKDIERLKAESDLLKTETRAILAALGVAL